MPQYDQEPCSRNKSDELIHLIQVILAIDIVFSVAFIMLQLQNRDERDGSAVEGDYPDAEDL